MSKFQPGDMVRRTTRPHGNLKVGDVAIVLATPGTEANYRLDRGSEGLYRHSGAHLELIARAGEPVTYLPGDEVEFTAKHAELEGRYSRSRRVGDRYTVIERQNDFAASTSVFTVRDGETSWAPRDYFKLVHRPDPVKAEPLAFTPPATGRPFKAGDRIRRVRRPYGFVPIGYETKALRDELDGRVWYADKDGDGHNTAAEYFELVTPPEPQVGDRVRVTFEGELTKRYADDSPNNAADQGVRVRPAGQEGDWLFTDDTVRRTDFKIEVIERPEPPLAVGDKARAASVSGEIVFIHDEHAMLMYAPKRYHVYRLSNLERVR